jgi:hypothetical protein
LPVLLGDAEAAQLVLEALRPPRPPDRRVVKTMPLSVRVEAGAPCCPHAARKASRTMGPVTRAWPATDRA